MRMIIQSFFTIMLLLLSTKFCIGQTFDDIDFIEKKESDLPKFGHGDLHDYIANSNTSLFLYHAILEGTFTLGCTK